MTTRTRTTRDLWSRRARVEDVHDGDTVTLWIDDGRDRYSRERARLGGHTYAPELDEEGGPETRDYVIGWLERARAAASSPDWPVVVTTVRTRTDRDSSTLGRYVYVVEDEDGRDLGTDVQAFVEAHGYAGGTGSTR